MDQTDVIIVLYGDASDCNRCVESVRNNCSEVVVHVIDNNLENLGFTKAVNRGIQQGKGKYIWLLSQDAVVLPGAHEAMVERMNAHPKVGIVGSMQLDPDDPDMIRHGGTARCFPAGAHLGGRISMGHCQIPSRQKWVNGASFMFRRSLTDSIGFLDESMFLLYSESDFCYMAREAGWEVWYEPRARVIHRLGQASKNSQEWQRKDMAAFMKKWGIIMEPSGRFQYSRRFYTLDLFP